MVVQGLPSALGIPLMLSVELCLQLVGVWLGRKVEGREADSARGFCPFFPPLAISQAPYLPFPAKADIGILAPSSQPLQPWGNSVQPIYAAGVGQSYAAHLMPCRSFLRG